MLLIVICILPVGGLLWLLRPSVWIEVNTLITDTEISFAAFGDQGTGNLRQWQVAAVLKAIAKDGTLDFVTLLGDNFYGDGVESTSDLQWRYKFENVYQGDHLKQTPFYAVLGNHDHQGNAHAQIDYTTSQHSSGRWQMPAIDYVQYFGRHQRQHLLKIVFLNTGHKIRDRQTTAFTLNTLLSHAENAIWTAVATHAPVRTGRQNYRDARLANLLIPILKKHRVDLYLSAHDHNQQVIEVVGEPLYIIAGSGGKYGNTITPGLQPQLLFHSPELGLARITVNPTKLLVTLFNQHAEPIFSSTRALTFD